VTIASEISKRRASFWYSPGTSQGEMASRSQLVNMSGWQTFSV
jgi:hypothetical protein